MIQRIQSIFLLVAIICSGLLFLVPVFRLIPADPAETVRYNVNILQTTAVNSNNQSTLMLNQPLLILNTILIVLSFSTIFSYQKRMRQAFFCKILLFLYAGLIILIIYYWMQLSNLASLKLNLIPAWGSALLLLAIVSVFISRFYILKDEALVRSADRLR